MGSAKAVALAAELRYPGCGCCGETTPVDMTSAVDVGVTIGLFTIVKIVRLVNLTVQSKGFCIPPECEGTNPVSPCEFFDSIAFPLNIFDPPQKEDFSGNTDNFTDNSCF